MTFPHIYLFQNLIVITSSTCRLAIVPHTYPIILLWLCFFNTEIKLHIVGGGGGNWWQQQWQIYYMCMDIGYCTYSIISSFKWNMLSAINTCIQSHIKAYLAVSPSIFKQRYHSWYKHPPKKNLDISTSSPRNMPPPPLDISKSNQIKSNLLLKAGYY